MINILKFIDYNHILTLIYILNIVFIITIIFYEKRKNTSTLVWILILSFTHVIGFVLYIFLGLSLRKRRFTKKYYKRFSFDKEKFIKGVNLDAEHHPQGDMIKLFNIKNHAYLRTKNKVKVYTDGERLFKDLITSLKEAKKYIHLEYYIFENDNIGTEIMDILVEKAKNNVEVILIYDGMGCVKVSKRFYKRLTNAGGEVLQFFPPFFSRFGIRANYRTHRKVALIDGKYGFLGGMNIGDEYLGRNAKIGYWRDTHVRIQGSGILGLEKEFLINLDFARDQRGIFKIRTKSNTNKDKIEIDKYLYFDENKEQKINLNLNKELEEKKESNKHKKIKENKQTKNVDLQIISSGPDYEETYIKNGFFKMITNAKKSIYIQTPYFIPDESILSALEIATKSGIKVNIMIPNKPDHYFVYWATLSYIGDLIKVGAKCYTYENGFLHSKVIIVDDEICSIGSANMDIRSFFLNFEITTFIYDKEIALELKKEFEKDIKYSELMTLKLYKQRSKIVKIKESISRLLSPIM